MVIDESDAYSLLTSQKSGIGSSASSGRGPGACNIHTPRVSLVGHAQLYGNSFNLIVMAGTYKPIAGLSPDNQGPANTVIAITLSATSILFSTVRYAVGRKRLLQFDSDDAVFCLALVCYIACLLAQTFCSRYASVLVSQCQFYQTLRSGPASGDINLL
jgi:hypothetical protein